MNLDDFSDGPMSFVDRIRQMNETFKLPNNYVPTSQGNDRLDDFFTVLTDELGEMSDIDCDDPNHMVEVADVLGDIIVYCFSEARRWGIPMLPVLHAIMDSQDSKLVDGKPLMAEDGSKFIKGPNYEPPEGRIAGILTHNGWRNDSDNDNHSY